MARPGSPRVSRVSRVFRQGGGHACLPCCWYPTLWSRAVRFRCRRQGQLLRIKLRRTPGIQIGCHFYHCKFGACKGHYTNIGCHLTNRVTTLQLGKSHSLQPSPNLNSVHFKHTKFSCDLSFETEQSHCSLCRPQEARKARDLIWRPTCFGKIGHCSH